LKYTRNQLLELQADYPQIKGLGLIVPGIRSGKRDLLLKKANIGFDRDKNLYFDIAVPAGLKNKKAFVIKIKLDKSKKTENKLMDAKI